MRFLIGMLLGITLPFLVAAAVLPKSMPGDQRLFAEAQRLSSYKCDAQKLDSFAAEAGEATGLCRPPIIIDRDLSAIGAAGAYDATTTPRLIYVDMKALKNPKVNVHSISFDEVVVHEYVHYLQWVNGKLKPGMNPCEDAAVEIEAHTVDQMFGYGKITPAAQAIIDSYKLDAALAKADGRCS